jgi:hypothetical protein
MPVKRAKKKPARTKRPTRRVKQSEGVIDLNVSLGELEGLAAGTRYLSNRAIMRAAIECAKSQGLPETGKVHLMFGMSLHRG